jgi:hypothetical protein
VGRSALYHAVDGSVRDDNRVHFVFALVDGGVSVEQLRQDYPKEKYTRFQDFEKSRIFQKLCQQNQKLSQHSEEPSQQKRELYQQGRRNTMAAVNAKEALEGAAIRERHNSMPALVRPQSTPCRKDSLISLLSSKLARTVSGSTQDSTNSKKRKSSKGDG